MRSGNTGKGAVARSRGRSLAAAVVASILVVVAVPMSAGAETVLERDALSQVLRFAVSDHFQRTVERRTTETACYFDPQAQKSMRCSFSSRGRNSASARSYMRDEIKSKLKAFCKEAGGSNCTLFMQNGELKFDGLSPEQSEKLESVLGRIPSYDAEAKPLPDGVDLASGFRDWFPGAKDYFDDLHRKRRFKNHHFAICANSAGTRSWSSGQGGGARISRVLSTCMMSCTAVSEMYSEEGDCYVVYEDGKFASEAAEAALTQ